ncbi:hypothetical protein HN937_05480, partial [Candidatus Poribacteria bacterium]|nr:hypothetical protein [Candidatus Poribacteria bacterium]
GAALVGAVAGMVAAVRYAEDLQDNLAAFEGVAGIELLDEEQLATVERANASLDALRTVAQAVALTLGGEFAPAVEGAGTLFVAMALMSKDLWTDLRTLDDGVSELAETIGGVLVRKMMFMQTTMARWLGFVGEAADRLGMDGLGGALKGLESSYDDFTDAVGAKAVDKIFGGLGDSVQFVTDGMGGYMNRAAQLIAVQREVNQETDKGAGSMSKKKAAVDEVAKALEQLQGIEERAVEATLSAGARILWQRDQEIAQIDALAEVVGESTEVDQARYAVLDKAERGLAALRKQEQAALDAQALASHEQRLREIEEEAAARQQATSMFLGGFADLAGTTADQINEHNADAAKGFFAFYKAAAISQIGVDGAVAAVKALATLGPVAGPIAAAGIAATTAGSAAAVGAEQLPSFHTGGRAPDESMAYVRQGERVLTGPEQQNMGGPAAVDAAAQGGSSGPRIFVWKIDHRTTGYSMVDHLARRPRKTIDAINRAQPRTGLRVPAAWRT